MNSRRAGLLFFFSSRRRHTRWTGDWSSDVCSSDLLTAIREEILARDPEALPGETSNHCYFCWYVLSKGIWRSEERRVGKECRSRWAADQLKKQVDGATRTKMFVTRWAWRVRCLLLY